MQTTGNHDAPGTHWVFQQHKKYKGRNEGYTSEIKKSLQGTNSGEDEAENQINDLEHKKEKSIQSEQQEEKRIQKKHWLRSLWDKFTRPPSKS